MGKPKKREPVKGPYGERDGGWAGIIKGMAAFQGKKNVR